MVEQIVASRHLGRQVGRQLWGREQHPAQKGGGRVHVARRERQRLVERVHKQRRAAHTQPVEGERLEEAMPRGRQPRVADGGGEHDLERELHVDRKGALGDAVEEGDAEVRERARAEQPLRGQGEQGELLALAQRLALLTAHRGRWHRNRVEVTAHIQGAQERRHIRRIEAIDGRLGDQVQQLPELEEARRRCVEERIRREDAPDPIERQSVQQALLRLAPRLWVDEPGQASRTLIRCDDGARSLPASWHLELDHLARARVGRRGEDDFGAVVELGAVLLVGHDALGKLHGELDRLAAPVAIDAAGGSFRRVVG